MKKAIHELTLMSIYCFNKWAVTNDKDYIYRRAKIEEAIKELEEIEKIHNHILDNFEDVLKMGNKELSINFAKFVEQIQKCKEENKNAK